MIVIERTLADYPNFIYFLSFQKVLWEHAPMYLQALSRAWRSVSGAHVMAPAGETFDIRTKIEVHRGTLAQYNFCLCTLIFL